MVFFVAFPLLRSRWSGCCCDGSENDDGFRKMACDVAGLFVVYGDSLQLIKSSATVLDRDTRCCLFQLDARANVKVWGNKMKGSDSTYDDQENTLFGP